MAACKQDGAALQYVPKGLTRSEMLKGANLKMVLSNKGGRMLLKAPKKYRSQDKLLLLAVQNGLSEIPNFAELYHQKPSLFVLVLRAAAVSGTLFCSCVQSRGRSAFVLR